MSPAPQDARDTLLRWNEIPPDIQDRIVQMAGGLPSGHAVWRCPRLVRGGWFKPDRVSIEYWWVDEAGDLVEAFWHE